MNFNDMISFDSGKIQKNANGQFPPSGQIEKTQNVIHDKSDSDEDDMMFERCSQDHPDLNT
jgi:hypothetical protein